MFEALGWWGVVIVVFVIFSFYIVTQLRKVVPTNEVHIVQRGRKSIPFGKGLQGGNVYLAWAHWVPFFWNFCTKITIKYLFTTIKWV